jgi:hypothetical protein
MGYESDALGKNDVFIQALYFIDKARHADLDHANGKLRL